MKRMLSVVALLALLALTAAATTTKSATDGWNALGLMRNAHYVYVTTYDGPQFSTHLLPGDSAAIAAVQNSLQQDGYVVVYHPNEADMIVTVQARPSSDLLAVYQGGSFRSGTYLWRAEAKNGLTGSIPQLVRPLERALERAGARG